MRIAQRCAVVLTALTFAAACSGDSVTETSGDLLTEQEVQEIFTALSAVGGLVMPLGPVPVPAGGPQLAPIPVSEDFSETASCPDGGSITVSGKISGTVDSEAGEMDLEFDLTQDMSSCGITTESLVQFIVDGAPDIDIVGDMALAGESLSGSLSYQGGFSWTADDERSGTCGVSFDVTFSTQSQTGTASGRICDRSITVDQ